MAVPVIRRRHFADFSDMHRSFDHFFGDWSRARGDSGYWVPAADIEESDDAWLLELDIPGVANEDVNVEVDGRRLSVSGERKDKEYEGELRRRGRATGQFEYVVRFSSELDADNVSASLADGVLSVRAPKHASTKPRKVDVS